MARRRRATVVVLAAVTSAVLLAAPASAHTDLASADPSPGAQIDGLTTITLSFEGALDPGGDHEIGLFDGDERLATSATTQVDDRTITADVTGQAPAAELTVRWFIVAGDGDGQRGAYVFTLTSPRVAGGSATAEPAPRASSSERPPADVPLSATAAPSATEPGSPVPAGRSRAADEAGSISVPILAGALVVGAVSVAVLLRRRRP